MVNARMRQPRDRPLRLVELGPMGLTPILVQVALHPPMIITIRIVEALHEQLVLPRTIRTRVVHELAENPSTTHEAVAMIGQVPMDLAEVRRVLPTHGQVQRQVGVMHLPDRVLLHAWAVVLRWDNPEVRMEVIPILHLPAHRAVTRHQVVVHPWVGVAEVDSLVVVAVVPHQVEEAAVQDK